MELLPLHRRDEAECPKLVQTLLRQGPACDRGSDILRGFHRQNQSHAGKGGGFMEQRGRKHHQDRVAETLREEIGAMIEGELSDPRIAFCYVTEVVMNPGAKSARVYVAVDNAVPDIEKSEEDTVKGLEAAKGYIRFELKERMGVRHVPELTFHADRS